MEVTSYDAGDANKADGEQSQRMEAPE